MAIDIGIVCEGSHDFNVLSRFLSAILVEAGYALGSLDCLQPTVAATFQTSDGGWTHVKSWCEADNGKGYRKYIDRPLFETSKSYDLIIIHLDGDVVEHCNSKPLSGLDIDAMSIEAIILAIKGAILEHWLSVAPDHLARVVACAPVRHLEAWLAAGSGSVVHDPESRPMKDEFRQGPIRRGRAPWRQKYIQAANTAVESIAAVRENCLSFAYFEADVMAATAHI